MRCLLLVLLMSQNVLSMAQDLRSGGRLKPEQANMDIRHYTVTLDVDPVTQTIQGQTETDLVLVNATDVLLFDLTRVLTVKEVWVNGTKQEFKHDSDLIYIKNKTLLQPGKVKVKIAYGGKPFVAANPPWKGGFQWTTDSLGRPWISVSCQGEGAKVFFPCKDHPSD